MFERLLHAARTGLLRSGRLEEENRENRLLRDQFLQGIQKLMRDGQTECVNFYPGQPVQTGLGENFDLFQAYCRSSEKPYDVNAYIVVRNSTHEGGAEIRVGGDMAATGYELAYVHNVMYRLGQYPPDAQHRSRPLLLIHLPNTQSVVSKSSSWESCLEALVVQLPSLLDDRFAWMKFTNLAEYSAYVSSGFIRRTAFNAELISRPETLRNPRLMKTTTQVAVTSILEGLTSDSVFTSPLHF